MMINGYPTNADKTTNRMDFCEGGSLEGVADLPPSLRDVEPGEGTNAPPALAFTAFAATSSNVVFSAAWTTNFPPGSRIELHEKQWSLTNAWSPVLSLFVLPSATNWTDSLTVATNGPSAAFYSLYADAISITFPSLASTVRASGFRLSVATTDDPIPVSVERSERPDKFPPYDPGFAADPFVGSAGLSYDPTNETLTAEAPGAFALPTGDSLVVLAPSITFGTPHDYAGDTLVENSLLRSETYEIRSAYPLDEPCLWEGWHVGTNSSFGCTCVPEFSFGADVSDFGEITNTVEVVDGAAVAKVFLGPTLVWSNSCEHARHWTFGGRSDFLSNDGCSSCSSCADGGCDAFDGPSLGSVRFRVSLGSPSDGKVSGFLWFDSDAVFYPSPSSFSLLKRPDAVVSDTTANGVRTVVCFDRGGRSLVVSNVVGGVWIGVTFTASGANDRSWEITRTNGAMRFRKFSAGGNLMSDVSYAPSGGVWTVTDNTSGRSETTVSTGRTLSWESEYSRTVETVVSCGAVTASVVRVTSSLVGGGEDAVVRETERREKRADGTWATSRASYWDSYGSRRNGQVRMAWGDNRAWSWIDYDEEGREVFRLDQRDGSAAPEDEWWYSIEWLPDSDAFATVADYEPHPGDSGHVNDRDKARTVSRYVVSDGAATLIARTWMRYVRGVAANGWPTVAETTIRACCQDAQMSDTNNAVSTVVRYDDESPLVPYLLRGETVSETDEDGVSTTHDYAITNGVVSCTSRKFYQSHPFPTFSYVERDLDYGLTLYESTRLTDAPTVEFGWRRHTYDSRNRLRFTQYDDGSSETNAYDCCRLLSRTDRNGAKTLYCSTPETEKLYHAEEEVGARNWNRGQVELGTAWTRSQFRFAYPAVLHFCDAFGRETNTVRRSAMVEGESVSPSFPSRGGFVTETKTFYPCGVSDFVRMVNERGVESEVVVFRGQCAEMTVSRECDPGEAAASVVITNIAWRGGGTESIRVADGHLTRTTRTSLYLANGCRRETTVTESDDCGTVTNSTSECDFLGRVVLTRTPLSWVTNAYDGVSFRIQDAFDCRSDVAVTNLYDEMGEPCGSLSRGVASVSQTEYVASSGAWWRVEHAVVYAGGVTNGVSESWTRLTGLSQECLSERLEYENGALMRRITTAMEADGRTVAEDVEDPVAGASHVRRVDGREVERVDRNGHLYTCYNPLGTVSSLELQSNTTDDIKNLVGYDVNGFGDTVGLWTFYNSWGDHRTASFEFDCRGNEVRFVDECGNVATNVYDSTGRVLAQGGSRIPVVQAYDSSGRLVSLKTARAGAPSDETAWTYDAATGLCLSKTYADGSSATNTWTVDGLHLRRVNPDGSWTESLYDGNRRNVGTVSSDASCAHALSLDVFGRTASATGPGAAYAYLRASDGMATNECASVSGLSAALRRTPDQYGRMVGTTLDGGETSHVVYAANGFIAAISNSEACASYGYNNVGRATSCNLVLTNGTVFTFSARRHSYFRDNVMFATSVCGAITNSYSYSYDVLNRPVSRNGDTFAYNARGEVTNATVAANASAYVYDGIGNLSTSSVATGGLPAVATSYAANCLNQYQSIWSASSSSWLEHSENGELTRLGDRGFLYDAKSRLVAAGYWVFDDERYLAGDFTDYDELYSFVPVVSNRYDHLDRRVQKITPAAAHTYFYDGWLLIKEIVANTNGTTDVIEYHWGKDLSGTIGGAGGVGGLLYLSITNSSTPNSSTRQLYIPFYDAYGNVMGYWDAQGSVVAQYTYDAFGKLIASSGPMADLFTIRYSTKYFDVETGLYYYGYRFYSPELMRWLSRDPIGEEGGGSLYAFCENSPVDAFDELGLWTATSESAGKSRRVYKFEDGDTLESLAKIVGLDPKEWQNWALSEKSAVADKTTASKIANASKPGCYVSVPNVWISADLLRGGNWYYDLFVNQGGTIGRFVGTDIFTSSNYQIVKADDIKQLADAFRKSKGNIWGLVVFGHGNNEGKLAMSSASPNLPSEEEGITWVNQTEMTDALLNGGYKVATAYLMQCYSAYKGVDKHGKHVDYGSAWRKVAVKFYGYKGVNAFGIDFGNKSKKHRRHGRRH